ncbi:MAG TPA: cell division protein ZapA [Candidatus Acidoferrales bacterium]
MAKSTKVEIYDQTYNIQGDLDEDYVAELGRMVDSRMRSIAQATRTVDSLRAAVLAALNLADELHAAQQRNAQLEGELRERAERCLNLVDQALKQSA